MFIGAHVCKNISSSLWTRNIALHYSHAYRVLHCSRATATHSHSRSLKRQASTPLEAKPVLLSLPKIYPHARSNQLHHGTAKGPILASFAHTTYHAYPVRRTPAAISFWILPLISGSRMALPANLGSSCICFSTLFICGSERICWISGSCIAC